MIDYDKILEEVSWRVKSGKPDLTNPEHLSVLLEVMNEFGIEETLARSVIKNLNTVEK